MTLDRIRSLSLVAAALAAGFVALAGTQPSEQPEQDPEVERIMDELEQEATRQTRTERPDLPSLRAPESDTPTRLVKEGTFLISRVGRMVRSPTGSWVFVQDNDPDSAAEPPMILMPCMNLMGMEAIAERRGEATTFTVTGQVFLYRNRNYLLPTMYLVNRQDSNLTTAQ